MVNDLVPRYIDCVNQWGLIIARGNPGESIAANAIQEEIQRIYQEILKFGGLERLLSYADDDNDCVRFVVASHIKEHDVPRAQIIYRQLTDSPLPFVAVSSQYILKELMKAAPPTIS